MVIGVENLFLFLVMEPFLLLEHSLIMEMEFLQDTLEYIIGMVVHGCNAALM